MPDIEHTGVIDAIALRRYADRILSLRADRKAVNVDMAAVFDEAKSAGFVPAMIRGLVRELEMEDEARNTYYATQDAYRRALGLGQLLNTPLGEATIEREQIVAGDDHNRADEHIVDRGRAVAAHRISPGVISSDIDPEPLAFAILVAKRKARYRLGAGLEIAAPIRHGLDPSADGGFDDL